MLLARLCGYILPLVGVKRVRVEIVSISAGSLTPRKRRCLSTLSVTDGLLSARVMPGLLITMALPPTRRCNEPSSVADGAMSDVAEGFSLTFEERQQLY